MARFGAGVVAESQTVDHPCRRETSEKAVFQQRRGAALAVVSGSTAGSKPREEARLPGGAMDLTASEGQWDNWRVPGGERWLVDGWPLKGLVVSCTVGSRRRRPGRRAGASWFSVSGVSPEPVVVAAATFGVGQGLIGDSHIVKLLGAASRVRVG